MPPKASLNVSLTPELMAYISSVLSAGQYRSASEVLRAGLRLLQKEDAAGKPPDAASPTPKPAIRERRNHG
jgi:antitoxin ParD1/3/4